MEHRPATRTIEIDGVAKELPVVYYKAGTSALYDKETDTYYNFSGTRLKDPSEYEADNDGRYY